MDIHVDDAGLVYVTDQCPRVIALNAQGEIIGACKPQVEMPHGISGDKDGNLYTAEVHSGRPQKFVPKPGADPAKLVGQPFRVAWK